ncbi:MAG: sugar ABC transporter substrate-binding protein, partial [Akkermansiaceae bacterium]|nr:sugar ABC transporter substrate-binding protein [Akkermansiaceae bacterium]
AKPYQRNMTLYQAVMAAGGATEFGAVNRVKLYRNDRVYTYDLNRGEHKLLKVYPKDVIDVPQKNVIGR